jgi:hypothetical protein
MPKITATIKDNVSARLANSVINSADITDKNNQKFTSLSVHVNTANKINNMNSI